MKEFEEWFLVNYPDSHEHSDFRFDMEKAWNRANSLTVARITPVLHLIQSEIAFLSNSPGLTEFGEGRKLAYTEFESHLNNLLKIWRPVSSEKYPLKSTT